ncbi:HAMP domain-containing protein [Pseudomonas sp. A-B-19]|uniref:HAMP domain-containing protein n=1 Tax=Pseudomonas sp. A-B-19 TaxID=2832405 RepID=UPI0039896354
MSSATQLAWLIALIAGMLSLVFALVGASFAGLIVRPIRSVASGLQGIAQGEVDLTQNLQARGNDETAQLASWFNHFLAAIRDLIHRIGQAANKISSRLHGIRPRSPATWLKPPGVSVKQWTWSRLHSMKWSPPPMKLRAPVARQSSQQIAVG